MNPFYVTMKSSIQTGTLSFEDALARINYGVAAGLINPDEANVLIEIARETPEVQEFPQQAHLAIRVGSVEAMLMNVMERLNRIEETVDEDWVNPHTDDPEHPRDPDGPPLGMEDRVWNDTTAYTYGANVWHDGAVWTSLIGNNRNNEPSVVGYAWNKVV